ncbi:MAG: 50S ribosomal protein L24 [Candidatus Micrarchaeota archaeon]|nr:50S ribosomal protein L24 [Candidatus Micrarchaeota archaeon]
MESAQKRKQRKFRFTAPMHERQGFASAHISKELATKLGIRKRSVQVRKGDTVKVMAGDNKGKTGKVSDVNLLKGTVSIDGIIRKNAKGKELPIPINASNVYITDMDMTDKQRQAKMESFKKK